MVAEIKANMKRVARKNLSIKTFMTHSMNDEDISALFTGRSEEFRRIMGAIRKSSKSSPGVLQHIVLYGARGFGKSFMTRRVQIAVTELDQSRDPIIYLLLPEEQHNLQRSPHALLDTIATRLEGFNAPGDLGFEGALFQWPKPGEDAKLWDEAQKRLEKAIDSALPNGNGLIVAVVENFDILLSTLFKEDENEQRLRLWLDRPNNRVMLFATATGTVDMSYDRPLFHAFETVRLSPWTSDDCIDYFNKQRARNGRPALDGDEKAKARAIAEFIGGTPRLAQLLAEVIDTKDALSVAQTMSALADKLAEYYRRRIEDLPPLARGLLDALIRGGEPASQTELAIRVDADGQRSIARVMNDLQLADIIRGRPALDSKETLYSVTDRVFVHYYRLRQGSRVAHITPLVTILDFLKSFYTSDEKREQALHHLKAGRPAEASLFSRLVLDAEGSPPVTAFLNLNDLEDCFETIPDGGEVSWEQIRTNLESVPEEVFELCRSLPKPLTIVGATLRAILSSQALVKMGLRNEARKFLEDALPNSSNDPVAHVILLDYIATFLCHEIGDTPASKAASKSIADIDISKIPERFQLLGYRLVVWSMTSSPEKVDACRKYYEIAVRQGKAYDQRSAQIHLSLALTSISKHEEALVAANLARDIAIQHESKRGEIEALEAQVVANYNLGRHEETAELVRNAAELLRDSKMSSYLSSIFRRSSYSLHALQRFDESAVDSIKAVGLALSVNDNFEFSRSMIALTEASVYVPIPDVVPYYRKWIDTFREVTNSELMADPRWWFRHFFLSATLIDAFGELDNILRDYGSWIVQTHHNLDFNFEHGLLLAGIVGKKDRATAYKLLEEFLTRVISFDLSLKLEKRNSEWLTDLVTGFISGCRVSSTLRDLAMLLSRTFEQESGKSATLLQAFAYVDEAKDQLAMLARLDPDTAILYRRLRNLPDPEPTRPKRSPNRNLTLPS